MPNIKIELNRRYSDLDLDMLVHPHTHDLVARFDWSAINGALLNIIKTKKGEKPFNPEFGSTIYHALFEPIHPRMEVDLATQIKQTVNKQEPRIKLHSVVVNASPDENGYDVSITYSPINEVRIVELEFFLERLR